MGIGYICENNTLHCVVDAIPATRLLFGSTQLLHWFLHNWCGNGKVFCIRREFWRWM